MNCPLCEHENTRVIDTKKSQVVERYRRCPNCNYSFATLEGVKIDPNWQQHAQYTDQEISLILKKRHITTKDNHND